MSSTTPTTDWQQTACILCSLNCGIEVKVEDRRFVKIRGDAADPESEGYICQKAARLDHYQNHARRLTQPLRRAEDGTFEPISWDDAITEIAAKLVSIRDTFGGHSFAYYGGGGQGNHMPGAYSSAFRAALDTPYMYTSLAQEKTGDFWVNGELFGRQTCHVTEDIEHADYVVILGANPWESHGISQARKVLRAISKDPERTLVVVDPRRTRTAELADVHIQVRPGGDAHLITAMLAVIVQEGLHDQAFIQERTVGFETIEAILEGVDVEVYAERAGVDVDLVRQVARGLATANSASTRHDLGLEHSLHSTLNCYLEKLLFLLTGNFAKKGGNNLHTALMPLIGHSDSPEQGGVRSRVTGMKEISKLFPPNILPLEIDTDHPERVRAVWVDSSNPIQSAADTAAYRKAFEKLDLLVVIDVAMTETAEMADYILPASTQYEKLEATFFSLTFPTNYFHIRKPILPPEHDTLPEPEIYHRLVLAMGALPAEFPELEAAAARHVLSPERCELQMALQMALMQNPTWKPYVSSILYATLGKALPEGLAAASVVWGAAQFFAGRYAEQVKRTGVEGDNPFALAEGLFQRLLQSPTAVPISIHTYDECWTLVRHKDKRVHLVIDELLAEWRALAEEAPGRSEAFPFILAAGERRTYNANQIYRDPAWRKIDHEGALRIHPEDADALGLNDGDAVSCTSEAGTITVHVRRDDSVRPGCLSLPHGYGQEVEDPERPGVMVQHGPRINDLTSTAHCDPIAKTPYHKYIPVRLER